MSPDSKNYTLFPIPQNEMPLYKLYKKSVAVFWIAEEINYTAKDREDWDTLSANEQYFIKHILAFFAGSDGIVAENLGTHFQAEATSNVVKLFYGFQNAMEGIHSEVYSQLIDYYVQDANEKDRLFKAIERVPIIQKKAEWCFKYMNKDVPLNERLAAFSAVEGIFFSGAFCSIFWLKKRNLLPALTSSNEFISRDEGLHTEFAIAYAKHLPPLPVRTLQEILQSAVALEKEFINDALPCSLIGMNSKLMCQYIEFVADRLCLQYNIPKLYNAANPFDFMEAISLERKTNFFEGRVSEYGKNTSERVFTLTTDF
jgi:ribonucleotide reductase beta subunit family protein with ferritin-like domain